MKSNFKKKLYTAAFFVAVVFIACTTDDDSNQDLTPPAQITNVRFTPLNGGGIFKYTVPRDEDFLYVRAVYTLDNGQEYFRVSSVFSDSILIEGLGSVKEYEVKLYTIDRKNNWSEPVAIKFTPLKSNPEIVLESVNVFPAFSGVLFNWTNKLKQLVTIFMTFEANGKKITRIISSVEQNGVFNVSGLESTPYNFSVVIKDDFGNETQQKSYGTITPIPDIKIDKVSWTFLRDELMPDSVIEKSFELKGTELVETIKTVNKADKGGFDKGWNAREAIHESRVQLLWDDIIDDTDLFTMNYFHTGAQRYPFSYYIDLGKTVKMSRVKIWQRDQDQWARLYGDENIKVFELWISDDKVNWEKVRRANIIKPGNPVEAKNEAEDGHEFVIYEDEPRFTKPFRYLEYRAIQPFSAGWNQGCASEITIFGEE